MGVHERNTALELIVSAWPADSGCYRRWLLAVVHVRQRMSYAKNNK